MEASYVDLVDDPPTVLQTGPAAPAPVPMTIKQAALAMFSQTEADLRALAEKYRAVAFDVGTSKGLDTARKARQEIRDGRYTVQRVRDKAKDELNALKKDVTAEAERLIAIVAPVEDHVHAQIQAEEDRKAAERAERERIENARKQKHIDAIAVIASYVDKAQGLPVERIEAGIDYVHGIDVSAEVFEEFAERAAEQKQVTIERLQKMVADQIKAQAAERMRLENERLAAELAEQKRLLAEHQAAIERQRQEMEEALQRAIAPAAPVATEGKADTPEHGTLEAALNAHGGSVPGMPGPCASSEPKAATDSPSGDEGKGAHADECAPEPAATVTDDGRPPINLGEINRRLGSLGLTRAFVEDVLGVQHTATAKAAVLWPASAFQAICDALIEHIQNRRGE